MLRIEMNPQDASRIHGADCAIFTQPSPGNCLPGDVITYCTSNNCEAPSKTIVWPHALKGHIQSTLPEGVRAMIGNAGCELTYRHLFGGNAKRNVRFILNWGKRAYDLIGTRLVLAPMDYDLMHDVMTGGHLLRWAAVHHVPLAIFCGYRFLFRGDEFQHIKHCSMRYDFRSFGNPYRYPFGEVSSAVRQSGATVWIGAGFDGGLRAGAWEKAQTFGFSGIFTTKLAWDSFLEEQDTQGALT